MNNKTNYIIIALLAILIVIGGLLYFNQNKSKSSTQSNTSIADDNMPIDNSTYGHVHALFRNADGSILMGTHNGLFKSVDQGKNFTKVEVAGAMAHDFMNFAYDPNTKSLFAGGHDVGVVKSIDSGAAWQKTDDGIKGTDIHALAINPLDTSRLYAYSVDNGIFGSKDNGKSWKRIDDGPDNPSTRSFGYMAAPSVMDRSMGTDQTTNIGYLWAGTGGGLYSSFACFCGWTMTSGISDSATIYTLAPDPQNRSNMFAGTKDGIYKTTDEGKTFKVINSDIKDVAAITFDLSDPNIIFAATSNGDLYKSEDNGTSWSRIQ